MKTLTDFRKTVETGVDPRRIKQMSLLFKGPVKAEDHTI